MTTHPAGLDERIPLGDGQLIVTFGDGTDDDTWFTLFGTIAYRGYNIGIALVEDGELGDLHDYKVVGVDGFGFKVESLDENRIPTDDVHTIPGELIGQIVIY